MHIFGRKQVANCAQCGKELGRHKYKPSEEWGIEGLLCGGCHIQKTREFMLNQEEEPDICVVCRKEIAGEGHKPKWQWEIEQGALLCSSCFQQKDAGYNKRMNFCTVCNGKLGMIYYHPKPEWRIEGNLCRKCWDSRNKG